MKVKVTIISIVLFLVAMAMQAQITIGGNVYGGGNAGNTGGSTKVTIYAGDLHNVYAGARQANVAGSAFLHIDGEHASSYIVIDKAYGGNDIAGTIGTSEDIPLKTETSDGLTEVGTTPGKNDINNTWNAFVRTSTKTVTTGTGDDAVTTEDPGAQKIFIGQLFGGGNGDYDYTSDDSPYQGMTKPDLDKTYLELLGGTIANAFGGGNNATINQANLICINNPSEVTTNVHLPEILTTDRMRRMGLNTVQTKVGSSDFQFGRVFGGNNKATMAIRPTWNLEAGKVRDLYSGGNEGNMTYKEGLLLEIPTTSTIIVDNVYGGCRRADVHPLYANGSEVSIRDIQLNPVYGYKFPAGLSARVLVRGGDVNNVYGGNDITGRVTGGTAVGIYTSIRGDVYGGGNGSYAYTDNPALEESEKWGDYYYNGGSNSVESVEALNAFRPNVEQVSLRLAGTDATHPTIIGGSVYVGGNSATVVKNDNISDPKFELKIGSHVIADKVFLGNNGENMVDPLEGGVLATYAGNVDDDGEERDFSSLELKDNPSIFAKYMDGCAMSMMPSVVFDKTPDDPADYEPYSTYLGSFYCGGNVGSMNFPGENTIDFTHEVVIFEKLVGGCNNAFVPEDTYNASYDGGLIAEPGDNGNKLTLNLANLKIQPMRWKDKNDKSKLLEWNTVKYNSSTHEFDPVPNVEATDDYKVRRLQGGNIYGGCYNSGHINGNVVININETLMERDKLFDVASDEEDILYENTDRGTYTITKRNTGVILSEQGMDALADALNVYGGGYGVNSEIWGSATINLNKGYVFQIFGGGEEGPIGKGVTAEYAKEKEKTWDETNYFFNGKKYSYSSAYSTYINLNGPNTLSGVARGDKDDSPDMAECEFIYGGGFEGLIAGDTHINLGNGRIFNSFAGSCNADILGHTETYIGRKKKADGTYDDDSGFPWIRDHIYGGNDVGGSIFAKNSLDFADRIRGEVKSMVAETHPASSYMEYNHGRVRNILGGCYGDYDYELDPEYKVGTGEDCRVANKTYMHNAFINFRPSVNANNSVEKIFGAGQGHSGDRDGDKGQDHSYVLIDIPDNVKNFATTEVFGAGAFNGLGMRTVIEPQAAPERDKYETDEAYNEARTAYDAYLTSLNEASAIIDLMRGEIGAAYGGSYEEGITRRTMVNVPVRGDKKSTIKINNIFGGAYGTKILPPCDVYEANVNYQSGDARVNGAIYGGNNNVRRTLYGKVNISAPVLKENGNSGYVYGAGRGQYTWSEYTEVNLESGAKVGEVYGGGQLGNVLNAESVQKYLQLYSGQPADMVANEDPYWGDPDKWDDGKLINDYKEEWKKAWKAAWTIDGYYNPVDGFTGYVGNSNVNLSNKLVTVAQMDERDPDVFSVDQKARTLNRYNTNVIIKEGATVGGYVYGGGYGSETIPLTGGVYGSTYVALLGGTVGRDLYAAGTTGSVCDIFGAGAPMRGGNAMGFIATANAYIEGGKVRNVYGGGWMGSVGYHLGDINTATTADQPGETHIVIGKDGGTSFTDGIPAIERNVYGGGEGGAVYGTTNVKMHNGYVGYRFFDEVSKLEKYKDNPIAAYETVTTGKDESVWTGYYQEKLHDETATGDGTNNLYDSGNIFGGGYVVNSFVDNTNVTMYGGSVRGSLYGGGELGPIGRGTMKDNASGGFENGKAHIYLGGTTNVKLFDGHVLRNVFGGGRGKDSWGGDGTKYMNPELVATLDLKSKGYVFGQTEVDVYGGEVGTDEGVALGYGNVFGGGDIGCVYSAKGTKMGVRYGDGENSKEGYYYDNDGNGALTEDCKVLIEPWCKANEEVAIDKTYFPGEYVPTSALNYLGNKTASKDEWKAIGKTDVNKEGIIIHNAVFAGGNTSPGSSEVYANTSTVFGNATASIHDVYNRDLISIGRGRVGGLYGDGNLTLVDGYRELNITNYGTDYYHIKSEIDLEEFNKLPDREAAYYEIRYKCKQQCTDKNGKTYAVNSTITADEMLDVFEGITVGSPAVPMIDSKGKPLTTYWEENGVRSRYAGRPMNTIQRADFCGVFGSRMVMQGAQDRVPEVVDYTNYTINRVREVSLNKKVSVREADQNVEKDKEHGNYFGIYSVVNYLGALTSDVDFHTAVRTTDNTDTDTYGADFDLATVSVEATAEARTYLAEHPIDGVTVSGSDVTVSTLSGLASLKTVQGVTVTASRLTNQTYYDWKAQHHEERKRNNGNSYNKVALASGVYLELTNENGTGTDLYGKKWGLITGVIELDLINVQPGMGGGYVYAKNEHGIRSLSNNNQTILTDLNTGAVTKKHFQYDETEGTKKEWETSGNFIHSTQTIIDDCYNIGDKYKTGYMPPDGVPAHYWYIKGAVYVYDQYISAYTGSPNAFSEVVSIPLTITSASHGKMTLLNVMPNRYAYYAYGTTDKLGADQKITIRDKEYGLNDAITYWDYSQLTSTEKAMFVEKTMVSVKSYKTSTVEDAEVFEAGIVKLPGDYTTWRDGLPSQKNNEGKDNEETVAHALYDVAAEKWVPADEVFRSSNNVSHDTGYILTYNIDNPNQWNTWYTPKSGSSLTDKVDSEEIKSPSISKTDYEDGPTYTPTITGMYGQTDYKVGSIIPADEYTTYGTAYAKLSADQKAALGTQATFNPAYIVTADLLETKNKNNVDQRLHKGATLAMEDYTEAQWTAISGSVALAYVVNSTVQLSKTEYVYRNTYLTEAEISTIKSKVSSDIAAEIDAAVSPAYYCSVEGKYGGNYYETGKNYRALAAFTAMSPEDRAKFTFNYDAFDLLVDPDYSRPEGEKYQYDGPIADNNENDVIDQGDVNNKATYSLPTSIDYTATYKGASTLTYIADDQSQKSATNGTNLTRTEFERLPNEQFYWAPITVTDASKPCYVVKENIVLGDTPYAAGQVITKETYDGLSDQSNVAALTFPSTGTYYYCREKYTIDATTGTAVTSAADVTGGRGGNYGKGAEVLTGVVINETAYNGLTNKQKNFAFHGLSPTETSTLYVTRGSDIFDLSKEKIITVVYQYDYVESDMSGQHITPVSERHILNIHINFKSGIPTVENIRQPDIILPGMALSMPEPYVTPGASEITGGGWKLFDTEEDAERHINGVEYTNSLDPLYLYQHGHYLAYYAKSYMGETFSNHVPVSVANYHDLKKVMNDKDHHYYIDHQEVHKRLKVEPKIYINDYSKDSEGSKNGLDLFKNLYDLSLISSGTPSGDLEGHALLSDNIKGGNNLEFFLRTDIDHSGSTWTPIGTDAQCFEGTLHGDGYTISGLDNSLFHKLCGSIYNLGVTGTFNTAGIVDTGTGYVESCWIKSEPTAAPLGTKPLAVFGDPTADPKWKQVVNCYYPESNSSLYSSDANDHGNARMMPDQSFYNGEVAYDLNDFYLNKRFYDKNRPSAKAYAYNYKKSENGKLSDEISTVYYPASPDAKYGDVGYVEHRFEDGDFIFADGKIPTTVNERFYADSETETTGYYYPIWPDDYLFFGQRLHYGYGSGLAHQDLPSHINKSNGRLTAVSDSMNRVYRAPAYFRSSKMKVAHFNSDAVFAQHKKGDPSIITYQDMTAIDFTGYNDADYSYLQGWNQWSKTSQASDGKSDEAYAFYPPLLDDDGLSSFRNVDLTQNLLAYTPSATANKKTNTAVTAFLTDLEYRETNTDTYRTVEEQNASAVYGHAVVKSGSDYVAENDHFLVDKNDFNAPISYSMGSGKRMWYQRTPENDEFVDRTKGWSAISLPFSAELVTTQDKGEITHFYDKSAESANKTNTKIGHEYWLRQYSGIAPDENNPTTIQKAQMIYPSVAGGYPEGIEGASQDKTVTNNFLWNHYYSAASHMDRNEDFYQTYYRDPRYYTGEKIYKLLTRATPYIIGFPGATYYEFDLSGNFDPQNTNSPKPGILPKQTITFASNPGITIAVSDTEKNGVQHGDYTFYPSYLNEKFEAGTNYYTLVSNYNNDHSSYVKVPASGDPTPQVAFRPFFGYKKVSGARGATRGDGSVAQYIIFDDDDSEIKKDEPIQEEEKLEGLIVNGGRKVVVVKSNLREENEVNIVNMAGVTLAAFTIQPGETITTNIALTGVYIVRTTDGRYTKKVLVR